MLVFSNFGFSVCFKYLSWITFWAWGDHFQVLKVSEGTCTCLGWGTTSRSSWCLKIHVRYCARTVTHPYVRLNKERYNEMSQAKRNQICFRWICWEPCTRICTRIYAHVYMYNMYICIHICIYLYTNIYIYTHMNQHFKSLSIGPTREGLFRSHLISFVYCCADTAKSDWCTSQGSACVCYA